MSAGTTNKARALALLGQLELAFERSDVPLPATRKRSGKARASKKKAPKRVRYDRDRFPTGYAADVFAKRVFSVVGASGKRVPRWPDDEDTRLVDRVPGAPITLHEMRFAAEHLKAAHPKQAKRLREDLRYWRAQAKEGEAPEVVDPPPASEPAPKPAAPKAPEPKAELEYVGPKLPRWVAEGVRLRVKVTPFLRKRGLETTGGAEGDTRAWPKEIGVIRRREGNGWWDWMVEFERGRRVVLDDKAAGYLIAVREEPPAPAKAAPKVTSQAALESAIVADALRVVDAAPHLPSSGDVRVYLRAGRKYIRVFWVRRSRGPEALGSVLYFVDKATGQVHQAKSSKAAGRPTGRFIEVGASDAVPPSDSTQPPRTSDDVLRELYRRSQPLSTQKVFGVLGMPRGVSNAREKQSGIVVRKRDRRAVSVEWVDWAGQGEDVRRARFDEAIEKLRREGFGFHLLSGEVGEAAVEEGRRRGIVLVHRPKAAGPVAAAPAPPPEVDPSHRPTPTRANHPDLSLKGLGPGARVAIEGEVYVVRSAAGGSSTWSVASGRGTGPDLYELKHERTRRIARLRVPGVVERETDDASPFAGAIAVTFGAKGSFGDAQTRINPRVERVTEAPASPSPAAEPAEAVAVVDAVEAARAHGRAVVQLAQVYFDALKPGTGATALEAVRMVLEEAVRVLSERPVAERRVFVDEVKSTYREAAELARSIQGDGWRAGGQRLLRRGTHAQVFTEDLDRAFKSLDVPRRYVLESPVESTEGPAPAVSGGGREVWERDRVVWYRPVDAGERERRVELRRGDTVWMSFGHSNVRKGVWGSVNGISKAKRQIKVDRQWVTLPLVYARDEVEGLSGMKPPPAGQEPAPDSDFGRLLVGLRTRAIRKLRIVSTDATPHDMRVDRALSQPGELIVDGVIKKSKARLTIQTAVDERGRPRLYARLRRGRRDFRVDARRIAAPNAAEPSATPPAGPTASATTPVPKRRETDFQRERRERAERKAARLERAAAAQHADARSELEHIPMGQPILVGHHSESRHRKAIERSNRKTRQALATHRAAESAKSAAKRAGYAISSDDPDALEALEARLAELEASRVVSKVINAAYRKGGWEAVEKVEGVTPKVLAQAKRTMEVAHWLKAPMDLKNLGANIRRVRKRIEELSAAAEREAAPTIEGDGFTITEHPDDNRIRFTFAERPSKDVTAKMKRAGFRWSRRHGAWQRQLSNAGRHAAERMAKELFGVDVAEARRQAQWQARTEAEHAEILKRSEGLAAEPPPLPSLEEEAARARALAAISDEDRQRYPADVIAEAVASGLRPERVIEMLEQSRREEEEMGRKLRQAARAEEAAHRRERSGEDG